MNTQVPCILGVSLTGADLLEFIQQVIQQLLSVLGFMIVLFEGYLVPLFEMYVMSLCSCFYHK